MRKALWIVTAIACTVALAGSWTYAKQRHDTPKHVMVMPSDVKWNPAPASLPGGAQIALLEGDSSKPGAFTFRLKMPDRYEIAPHWHPADEHATVLQGTLVMGLGVKFDRSAGRELSAGSFAMLPNGTRHFAWTKGETIIQVHGVGPWSITYVNPADDPRRKGR